jgi:hypothetical protein
MDNENNQVQKKNKVVIVLGIAIVICAVILTIVLISVAAKSKQTKETTLYTLTDNNGKITTTEEIDLNELFGDEKTENPGSNQTNDKSDKNNTEKTTKNKAVAYYEQLSPNGENILSDHYDNKYIKKVEKKYKVDSELLVAIYSDPDTGNNFVLQFNGKRDKDGNVIKSPDTLEKVYHIDKKGNIKVTTGTEKGNEGVSYAEGMMVFNMIKAIVMEQYPDYFTGLSK